MQGNQQMMQTMYIKFPAVTKLTYPQQLARDQSGRHNNLRQKLMLRTQNKLDIVKHTQGFKIVSLPPKNDVMNICSMPVTAKVNPRQHSQPQQRPHNRNIFSVRKLNTHAQSNRDDVRPWRTPSYQEAPKRSPVKAQLENKRSQSSPKLTQWKSFGQQRRPSRVIFQTKVHFDYFQIYPQILRLIALNWGLVLSDDRSGVRRGRVDGTNNGLVVKQTLKRRQWWHITGNTQMDTLNMIWTGNSLGREVIGHFATTNQQLMKQKMEPLSQELPTFQRNIDKILEQIPKIKQLFFTEEEEGAGRLGEWLSELLVSPCIHKLHPDELTLTNHLLNSQEITNKKMLYSNMEDYYYQAEMDPFEKLPRHYHLTCHNWKDLTSRLVQNDKLWILKPGEFSNRGRGITVFKNTKEAVAFVASNPPVTPQKSWVLQEYITPMLYEGRKFDIRCFMLGVQVGPRLFFYWYQQGYIRTASQKFTTKRVSRGIHLTNDAVQQRLPHYSQHEPANKLSYQEMEKYCQEHSQVKFGRDVLPHIKTISRDICRAVTNKKLIGAGKGVGFQLWGLDFLVDEKGRPWLCEVNNNPSLQISSSLLSRIIPQLIDNTFRLVNDVLLPTKKIPQYAQHFITHNKYCLLHRSPLQ